MRRPPKWLLAGLGAGALAWIVSLMRARGRPLVLYQTRADTGVSEMRETADRIHNVLQGDRVPVGSAADVYRALESRPRRSAGPVVIVGHGTPREILPQYNLDLARLARGLAHVTVQRGVIGLANCRTAANPGEPDWYAGSYGPGGERGVAARLRDALYALGWRGSVRAHATVGHVTANPAAREFPSGWGQAGQPGLSVLDLVWGEGAWCEERLRDAWRDAMRGKAAELWITGWPLPRIPIPTA